MNTAFNAIHSTGHAGKLARKLFSKLPGMVDIQFIRCEFTTGYRCKKGVNASDFLFSFTIPTFAPQFNRRSI